MKITPNTYRPAPLERSTQSPAPAAAQSAAQKKPSSSAVALSATARHLQQVESTSQDIDMARVQALREAINNGTLKIDTGRIADGLIASTRELLK